MKKVKRFKRMETPSLEWIHRVRRERQAERRGRPILPLSKKETEKLAKQYGLKIARPTTTSR
jgi:tRNA(Ile)-lysidine synthase TilS/MesJ